MARKTKKAGEGRPIDLEHLKKTYIQCWGGCDGCGSEDLEFSETGNKKLDMPVHKIRCKNCGSGWKSFGVIDSKKKRRREDEMD